MPLSLPHHTRFVFVAEFPLNSSFLWAAFPPNHPRLSEQSSPFSSAMLDLKLSSHNGSISCNSTVLEYHESLVRHPKKGCGPLCLYYHPWSRYIASSEGQAAEVSWQLDKAETDCWETDQSWLCRVFISRGGGKREVIFSLVPLSPLPPTESDLSFESRKWTEQSYL